jgi:histidine triad (HIT) family protein
MSDCVFCKIRDGQLPSMKIFEDERTLCFMDINPLNSGHCLVATKRHAATVFDAEDDDLKATMVTARRVALALRQALKPDGLNILQANGAAAFQSVPHFHLHLIPRWTNDGKGFDWKQVAGDRNQIMKVGERVRAAISSEGASAAPSDASPSGLRGRSPRSEGAGHE